tara:strand:+ start:233 stop:1096 length:864 start_codon:yes stop_codon:yes gene_type:complete
MIKSKNLSANWIFTAKTLSEALPYIQRYNNAKIVIKLGGHAMLEEDSLDSFAKDIVLLKQCNLNPIVIHGGGPMIDEMLKKNKIETKFINGKRITDKNTIDIVEMVLCGKINKEIVSLINKNGGKAVGFSGKDGNLIICNQENSELGFVGSPDKINNELLNIFLDSDFIPIISPIGMGNDGNTYNINADTVAGKIASSLKAERLLLLTDVSGVKNIKGEVLTNLSSKDIFKLINEKIIVDGMIPKTLTAIEAVKNGVNAAIILDGRTPNACLLELLTDHGVGTLIRK